MRIPKVLDSTRARIGFALSQARWAITSRWRRVRGQHGAFAHGEISARARHLTDLWERTWPRAQPLAHLLRDEYAGQWVRFHSLPESKRYAENEAEYKEVSHRHRSVLDELRGSHGAEALQVIAEDWDWRDLAADWSKNRLTGAWPWRSSQVDDDLDAGRCYFWAASGLADSEIDSLLRAAADDRAHVVIGAPHLDWLYCPYDGGADVFLPSTAERDALKARHADWLSSYPGGL